MKLTIRTKLFAIALVGIATTMSAGLVGQQAAANLAASGHEAMELGEAQYRFMTCDMMHDAIRADVLAALLGGTTGDKESAAGVRKDLQDHATAFRESLAQAQALDLPEEIGQALSGVAPALADYVKAGEDMVELAYKDPAAAHAQFAEFSKAFERLEEANGKVSEQIAAMSDTATKAEKDRAATATTIILAAVGIALVLLSGLSWAAARSVVRPLSALSVAMRRLSGGDRSVEVPGVGRRDEIGEMAETVLIFKQTAVEAERLAAEAEAERRRSVEAEAAQRAQEEARRAEADAEREARRRQQEERTQKLVDLGRAFDAKVRELLARVGAEAGAMDEAASAMAGVADDTSRQAGNVSVAATQASANVQTVAAAAEELAGSVSEIGRQVAQSARIAAEAVTETERTNQTVEGLAAEATRIGEVINLINDIAAQTNLLALNATIEAARAGEAGKGFAVVASEVKNLATQTAKATEGIASQIQGIQASTSAAVEAIRRIGTTIAEVNAIASSIAAAVEEQGAATAEISRNVQQAATGTEQVSRSITSVSDAASGAGRTAERVRVAATTLTGQSRILQDEIAHFLDQLRAA
jgi:methyl-accepting chemotaxis protein